MDYVFQSKIEDWPWQGETTLKLPSSVEAPSDKTSWLLALDPGLTTGAVMVRFDWWDDKQGANIKWFGKHIGPWPVCGPELWGLLAHADYAAFEKYIIYDKSVRGDANTGRMPVPLRIFGVIEIVDALFESLVIYGYTSAQVKAIKDDCLLLRWGNEARIHKTKSRHFRDALRVASIFIMKLPDYLARVQ